VLKFHCPTPVYLNETIAMFSCDLLHLTMNSDPLLLERGIKELVGKKKKHRNITTESQIPLTEGEY